MTQYALVVEEEHHDTLHIAMEIDSWEVELHGTLETRLCTRVDKTIDNIQEDTFSGGDYRLWRNGTIDILLPGVDNDIVFVFTHIIQHFLRGGIGLRQICDWCRLLWMYRESVKRDLLGKRLQAMGLMTEWKAFATLAVNHLGMPASAMPFYSPNSRWKRKAGRNNRYNCGWMVCCRLACHVLSAQEGSL